MILIHRLYFSITTKLFKEKENVDEGVSEWFRFMEHYLPKSHFYSVVDDRKSYFFRNVTLHVPLLPVCVQSKEQEKHFLWSCIFLEI